MRFEDLDYELPEDLIAQHPAPRRDAARLLVVDRAAGALHDAVFGDLPRWLRPQDALALNTTRVFPARLLTRRARGAGQVGGRVELLLVRPEAGGTWRVLARPAKRAAVGAVLETDDGCLALEVADTGPEGERTVRVVRGTLDEALEAHGQIPLPPYIRRAPEPEDRERYQTVFARERGAVAAPTAGLHFTGEMLAALETMGTTRVEVLLHVGPGTFRPVTAGDPARHRMDEEYFEVGGAAAGALNAARARGGRVVAVGTTVVRALETACDVHDGAIGPASGWTRKYILPPYAFRAVDAMVTNFHLPRTTLLLLVAAFAGPELTRRAYAHAVARRYRFYSYGDAMLVI